MPNDDHNIKVHVQRVETIGKGRYKVKVTETGVRLSSLTHNGKKLVTARDLGRGRYVMREA